MALQQMQTDYLSSEIVLHSHSPPTLAALRHKSPVACSYFSVAPGITCTCVTVPPFGLFVFVYDAAEHPESDSVTAIHSMTISFYMPHTKAIIWISFLCALCSLKISARLLLPKARPIPVAAAESNVNCGMASEAIPNVAVPAKINPDEIFFL